VTLTKTLFQGKNPQAEAAVPTGLGSSFIRLAPDLRPGYHMPPLRGWGRVVRSASFHADSISCWNAAVFLQPLQFLAHFDFAVPGILAQAVAFAGEDQQGVRNS
jgi:hypothetical protein